MGHIELKIVLQQRFEKNKERHPTVAWETVLQLLDKNPNALATLERMEETGGEPDVVELEAGKVTFVDCCIESPKERRSLCYDFQAWNSRKENKPKGNAVDFAQEIGIQLLNENEYRKLQEYGDFDTKTSSWVETPQEIRKHGGAVFCDKRYKHVFFYHNGAESYYAARGFRGKLEL